MKYVLLTTMALLVIYAHSMAWEDCVKYGVGC